MPRRSSPDFFAQASAESLPKGTGVQCGHRVTEAGAAMFHENPPLVKASRALPIPQDKTRAPDLNF